MALGFLNVVVFLLPVFLLPRAAIAANNLALRQQLAVMRAAVHEIVGPHMVSLPKTPSARDGRASALSSYPRRSVSGTNLATSSLSFLSRTMFRRWRAEAHHQQLTRADQRVASRPSGDSDDAARQPAEWQLANEADYRGTVRNPRSRRAVIAGIPMRPAL